MATTIQPVHEFTVDIPRESASVRIMARYFFAVFWSVVFTGAIRKWLFPGVTALYLLQDIPIAMAYLYALKSGLFTRGYVMLGAILLSALLTLMGILQVIATGLSLSVLFIGLHHYLFYLPILFVFPLCLSPDYRKDFVRWNLLLSIPMCLLAIVQNQSPKSAFVNKSSMGDAFGIPGVDIARVTGTFNFTLFYSLWVAIAVALCMGEWLVPEERRAIGSRWLLIVCTFCVNICHLVSASRSAIALSMLAVVGAMVAAMLLRSSRATIAIAGICFLLPVAAAMTYVISPVEFNTIQERFTGDFYVSDGKERLIENFIGFATLPRFDLMGAGIGMGVDAAHVGNADAYLFTYSLAEQDMIRNVMELGTPVGLLYSLIRILFGVSMVLLAVRIVRTGSSPHVLPLSFVLCTQTYIGDMTRNATMTATQVMLGFAFILSAFYHPDELSDGVEAGDNSMRFV